MRTLLNPWGVTRPERKSLTYQGQYFPEIRTLSLAKQL